MSRAKEMLADIERSRHLREGDFLPLSVRENPGSERWFRMAGEWQEQAYRWESRAEDLTARIERALAVFSAYASGETGPEGEMSPRWVLTRMAAALKEPSP